MPPDTIERIKASVTQLEATLIKDLSREGEVLNELKSIISTLEAAQSKLDGAR